MRSEGWTALMTDFTNFSTPRPTRLMVMEADFARATQVIEEMTADEEEAVPG